MNYQQSHRLPLWGTRAFRWAVIATVLLVGAIAVAFFELKPKFEESARLAATRQKRAFDIRPLPPELAQALAGVTDGTAIQEHEEGRFALFEHLHAMPREALAATAQSASSSDLAEQIQLLRGQPVRVTAHFLAWDPGLLSRKIQGSEVIYRAYLMDAGGDEGYVVELPAEPRGFERMDLVEVDGLLLKIGTYEAGAQRTVLRHAPMLVAHELRRRPQVSSLTGIHDSETFTVIAASTIAATGILWILFNYLNRRAQLERLAQMQARLAESAAAGPRPVPRPVPLHGPLRAPIHAPGRASAEAKKPRPGLPIRPHPHYSDIAATKPYRAPPPRALVLTVFTITVALLGYTGFEAYRRFFVPPAIVSVNFFDALAGHLRRAEEARAVVQGVQAAIPGGVGKPRPEEYEKLRAALTILEDATDAAQALLEEARIAGWRESDTRPAGVESRDYGRDLLRMKLWIADLDGLLLLEKADPPYPGVFLPLARLQSATNGLLEEWRRVDAHPSSESSSKPGDEAPRAREAVHARLVELAADLEGFAASLRSSLGREELPFGAIVELQPLADCMERVQSAIGKPVPEKASR